MTSNSSGEQQRSSDSNYSKSYFVLFFKLFNFVSLAYFGVSADLVRNATSRDHLSPRIV